MKTARNVVTSTLAAVVATGALAVISTEADARHPHRARVGVYIGAPIIAAPFYHRPYFYGGYGHPFYSHPYYAPAYYPPVVVREQPLVYIEQPQPAPVAVAPAQPAAPAPQAQQQYWYFCQDSQTYYPHAQTWGSPWQRVSPHAPPSPQ